MPTITLNVTLTLQGPVLSKSSSSGEYGIDAAMARRNGNPFLPGTLVLGRLRQSLEELLEATDGVFIDQIEIDRLLGRKKGSQDSPGIVDPDRKTIYATDFVATDSGRKDTQYRIRMDDNLGAAAQGAYLVIDSAFAPGSTVHFEGRIRYVLKDGEADTIRERIKKGLCWTTSFGAQRTVGFGRLHAIKIETEQQQVSSQATPDQKRTHWDLLVKPQEPFCIAKRKTGRNLFESEDIIPGGVLKGAIASTWGMLLGKGPNNTIDEQFDRGRIELSRNFDKIRFTHGFPTDAAEGKRPVCFPQSLVKYDEIIQGEKITRLDDVARKDKAELFGSSKKSAPAFSIDWKKSGDVLAMFGWRDLSKELRVRTAMDRTTRSSKEAQLFAYEMIVPDGYAWKALIDMSRVDNKEREKVQEQLSGILAHGLTGFGKTKSYALTQTTITEPPSIVEPPDDIYVITLQTPAVLCDPDGLDKGRTHNDLLKSYTEAWDNLSGGALQLVRFFARQSLAGGYYLHNRFQSARDYYPWLLTDPGSVFVLKKVSGGAHGKIVKWLQCGLPMPDRLKDRYKSGALPGDDWRCCPYIPENGYGEIAVNIDLNEFKSREEAQP